MGEEDVGLDAQVRSKLGLTLAFDALQSSHGPKLGAVCLSRGSERFAPGKSIGERVTSISFLDLPTKVAVSRECCDQFA